jgi:hypothetical protein
MAATPLPVVGKALAPTVAKYTDQNMHEYSNGISKIQTREKSIHQP